MSLHAPNRRTSDQPRTSDPSRPTEASRQSEQNPQSGQTAGTRPVAAEHLAHLQDLNDQAWHRRETAPDDSARLAQEALDLAEALDQPVQIVAALRTLSIPDIRHAEHRVALDRLNRAMRLLADHPDNRLERDCKMFLAGLYNALSNVDRATTFLLEARTLSRELGDLPGEASALLSLGVVSAGPQNDPFGAATYLSQALALYRQTGDIGGQATTLTHLADALIRQSLWDDARATASAAVQTAQESGNLMLKAAALTGVARTSAGTGDAPQAAVLYDESLALLTTLNPGGQGDLSQQSTTELYRAENLITLGQYDQAEQALNRVLRLLEGGDLQDLIISAHRTLADVYKRTGHHLEAMTHADTAWTLKEAHTRKLAGERTQGMILQFEVDRAQSETEIYRVRTVELGYANARLEEAARERASLLRTLQEQQALLERQVREDALSGLYNRRHAEVLLGQAFEDHLGQAQTFVVCMIDIDHFKRVNDHYSHQTGDEVIRQVGRLLKNHLREDDMVGRYGGEEFVMMLADISLEDARKVMERLRLNIQNYDWEQVAPTLKVTLSVGAALNTGHATWERIVGAADVKLYEAKRTRNTVAC